MMITYLTAAEVGDEPLGLIDSEGRRWRWTGDGWLPREALTTDELLAAVGPVAADCTRCARRPAVDICCSTHQATLCHRCYRHTHFVEVCYDCELCAAEGLPAVGFGAHAEAGRA